MSHWKPSSAREILLSLEYVVDDLDLTLLMTVNLGFGGQTFIESQMEKVGRVREMIGDRPIRLEIDGGAKSGDDGKGRADADIIVASSAVFKGGCSRPVVANIAAIRPLHR
jgi:ribulose-phosphate 3-epimerase